MGIRTFVLLAALLGLLALPARSEEPAKPVDARELRDRLAERLNSPEVQLKLSNPAGRVGNPRDRARSAPAKPAKPAKPAPPKPWGYAGDVGPERWGELSPEHKLCAVGTRQSPLDLRDTLQVDQEPIQFDYKPTLFSVLDTGRTLLITPEPGNFITVGQRRYELQAIEARMPAETRIRGERFDMSLHLLHRDAEGRLAMLALQLRRALGEELDQPVLQRFWNHLPLEKQVTEKASVPVDLAQLLPADRAYFSFMGSLTTPPCTEGVLWLVMRDPLPVSTQQLAVMERLYPANARPVQPAGGRIIKESF